MNWSNWFNIKSHEMSLGTSQKCGYGTLNNHKRELGAVRGPFPEYPDNAIWFVREPVARFKSFYKWLNSDIIPGNFLKYLRGLPIDHLQEYIEDHWNDDQHWAEQTFMRRGIPSRVVRFERMPEFLPIEVERQHVTNSHDVALTAVQVAWVERLYERDTELWLGAE